MQCMIWRLYAVHVMTDCQWSCTDSPLQKLEKHNCVEMIRTAVKESPYSIGKSLLHVQCTCRTTLYTCTCTCIYMYICVFFLHAFFLASAHYAYWLFRLFITPYLSNAVISAKSSHYFSCPFSTEAVGFAHKPPCSL